MSTYEEEIAKQHGLVKLADDECIVCYEKTSYKNSCNYTVCEECTPKIYYPTQCPYCRQIRTDVCGYCKIIKTRFLSCNHRFCSKCHYNWICIRCAPFRTSNCIQCEPSCICKIVFCSTCNKQKAACICISDKDINFIFESLIYFGFNIDIKYFKLYLELV